MGKGSLVYDPNTLEFRRRERPAPWKGTGAPTPGQHVAEPAVAATPDPDLGPDAQLPAASVEKPEGYVDPTPIRRRRKRRKSETRESRESSTAWRGIMWGVIMVMAVLWVYMLYTSGKNETNHPKDDEFFIWDRNDVIYTT